MLKVCLAALLSVTASIAVGGVTFARAKMLADQNEKSLSESQQLALTQAQAVVVQAALSTCLAGNGPRPFSFVVVAELNKTGRVVQTWRSEDSPLATCFQHVVAQASLNAPPATPFYTSFEMNLSEDAIKR